MLKLLAILTCIAAVSAASDADRMSDREYRQQARRAEKRHKALASQPTPPEWRAGAVWRFVTTPPAGKPKLEVITFRVTDESGVSCLGSGGWKDVWRKFVVLEGDARFGPIYQVEGRALQINLSGEMCDAYDIIDGVLTGGEFTGRRTTFGLGASTEVVGIVHGSLMRP